MTHVLGVIEIARHETTIPVEWTRKDEAVLSQMPVRCMKEASQAVHALRRGESMRVGDEKGRQLYQLPVPITEAGSPLALHQRVSCPLEERGITHAISPKAIHVCGHGVSLYGFRQHVRLLYVLFPDMRQGDAQRKQGKYQVYALSHALPSCLGGKDRIIPAIPD